jgi:hypothetical protein
MILSLRKRHGYQRPGAFIIMMTIIGTCIIHVQVLQDILWNIFPCAIIYWTCGLLLPAWLIALIADIVYTLWTGQVDCKQAKSCYQFLFKCWYHCILAHFCFCAIMQFMSEQYSLLQLTLGNCNNDMDLIPLLLWCIIHLMTGMICIWRLHAKQIHHMILIITLMNLFIYGYTLIYQHWKPSHFLLSMNILLIHTIYIVLPLISKSQ